MKKLWHEPLIHFLALGAVLFVIAELTRDPGADRRARIAVTGDDVNRLSVAWERQWRRPPTETELANLVRSHIREEILYREALALGLDSDDTIVRRRLVQKMEFLSEDTALQSEPATKELAEYFEAHADDFTIAPRTTFFHVYLSRDRRGDAADADAGELLVKLAGTDAATGANEGDRFMLQRNYSGKSETQIGQLFGRAFAAGVAKLEVGHWHGPIESGYGVHLVFVQSRSEARLPPLEEVRDDVRNELISMRRREANRALYERLRKKYALDIEDPELASQLPEQVMDVLDER